MRVLAYAGVELEPAAMDQIRALAGGRLDSDDPQVLLISTAARLNARALDAWPSLRHVTVCGTSLGRIDLDALRERGITWSNVRDYGDHPVAEVMFAQLVWLARGLAQPGWGETPHELAGRRLVIVGAGDLGRAFVPLARAYGMEVAAISRTPKPDLEASGVTFGTRAELLPEADVVVLSGPTDVEVLGAGDVALLRDGVVLIQVSAGRAADPDAVAAWLRRPGNVAVIDEVPDPDAYPHAPNVIRLPLVTGLSREATRRLGERVVANVERCLSGAGRLSD